MSSGITQEEITARLSTTREEVAHKGFSRAVARIRELEKELGPAFKDLQKYITDLDAMGVEVKCKMNPYMTEAWREWQVKEQVKREKAK